MKTLKMMFTIALSLLLCVTTLSACQPSKPDPQSGNDTATTTTEATTTTTDTATTTTTAPADEFTINEDRLSEIGKTFAELKEQYGEVADDYWYLGGKLYRFQESVCSYLFENPAEWGAPPTDDAQCKEIFRLRADQLFNGLAEAVSAADLAEMYGLEHLWSKDYGDNTDYAHQRYMSKFRYNDYAIAITTQEDFQIGPDTNIEYIEISKE